VCCGGWEEDEARRGGVGLEDVGTYKQPQPQPRAGPLSRALRQSAALIEWWRDGL
jgi:hypothetical protein